MQDQDDALSSTFEDAAESESSTNDRELGIDNMPKYSQEWFRLKEEQMALRYEADEEDGAVKKVNTSDDEAQGVDTVEIAADEDALGGVKPHEGTIEILTDEGAPLPVAQMNMTATTTQHMPSTFAPVAANAYQETTKEQTAKKQVPETIFESSSGKTSRLTLDTTNNAPVPVAQTICATKEEVKEKSRPEVLDSVAPQPLEASSHDDSLLREKEKMTKHNVQIVIQSSEPSPRSLEGIVSRPSIDEERQILTLESNSPRSETTRTTAPSTIVDAFSERASEVRYTEDTEIFIPEATIVEEPDKEDIPAAGTICRIPYFSLTILSIFL